MNDLYCVWKNRLNKFRDNPSALWPFLKKYLYYNFVADTTIKDYTEFKYLNYNETISVAIADNKSIVRFGDELFDMLQGIGLYFGNWRQRYRPELAMRLKEIISSNDNRLLICFNPELILKTKREFQEMGIPEQWQFWTNSKIFLRQYYRSDVTYGSALCFHPRYNTAIDFKKLGKHFATKDIVVVTSDTERFSNLTLGKTTTFVDAPISDAWDEYDSVRERLMFHILERGFSRSNTLILISMGSAAKVLVYDLMQEGYVAWDTGQFFDLAGKTLKEL